MALHVSPPSCCTVYTQIRTHHRQPLVRHPRMPARRSGAHAQPWSACASASPCACRTDTSCSMSAGRRTCCGAMLCHMSAFSASAGMEARYQEVTSKREGYSSSQMTGADWSYQFHTVCMQHAAGHLAAPAGRLAWTRPCRTRCSASCGSTCCRPSPPQACPASPPACVACSCPVRRQLRVSEEG